MDALIAWCAFAGAWLLLAGPLYQALLELQSEEIERDRIEATLRAVPPPAPVAPWWWLLPPVALLLQKARQDRFRREAVTLLEDDDFDALVGFVNKAFAWQLVALGGLLIAMKETWALTEEQEWPTALFWILVAAMGALCVGHAALRSWRSRRTTELRAAARVV